MLEPAEAFSKVTLKCVKSVISLIVVSSHLSFVKSDSKVTNISGGRRPTPTYLLVTFDSLLTNERWDLNISETSLLSHFRVTLGKASEGSKKQLWSNLKIFDENRLTRGSAHPNAILMMS